MPLPDPKLDDRQFQDLVNEAKLRIPHYTPEWTDHNVSDPGVTLIELFAWMTDLILYRLNRVPEKNYIRFMDLLGVRTKDAVPASTRVSFRLSAPQPGPVPIPRGTEVATVRTGSTEAISFTTDRRLTILPPTLTNCLFSADSVTYADRLDRIQTKDELFDAFQEPPLPGNALYFGFPEDLSSHLVAMDIVCTVQGIGVDPDDPPLAWEAWCGDVRGWTPASVQQDDTGGLNESGRVVLDLPDEMETRTLMNQTAHWLRLRVTQARPGQPLYSASPRIDTMAVSSIGASAEATHSRLIGTELPGRVTGAPGERFFLNNTPILPRREDEHLEIEDEDGNWSRWEEVSSFRESDASCRHYMIDSVTGEIMFGPRIRHTDGSERSYGMQPHRGSSLRMTRYRTGGGIEGNVGANTLTILKSSIPYVSRVVNPTPAIGGLDPESLEAAKDRTPLLLRSRDRAVTAEDYEFLAREADRRVARAKAIQVRGDGRGSAVPPGTVELLIVPVLDAEQERTLDLLQPPPDLLDVVSTYLDERRLLSSHLAVDGPAYVGVSVEANIVVQTNVSSEVVRNRVHDRIKEYLDPLLGGPSGDGWPFGRDLFLSEMQSVIQAVPGVEYAQDVTLYQVDTQTAQSRVAGQNISLAEDVLLFSFEHTVNIVTRNR